MIFVSTDSEWEFPAKIRSPQKKTSRNLGGVLTAGKGSGDTIRGCCSVVSGFLPQFPESPQPFRMVFSVRRQRAPLPPSPVGATRPSTIRSMAMPRTVLPIAQSPNSPSTNLRSTAGSKLPRFEPMAVGNCTLPSPSGGDGSAQVRHVHDVPAPMGSVDCWPLAIITTNHSGSDPVRYPSLRRDRSWGCPSWLRHVAAPP